MVDPTLRMEIDVLYYPSWWRPFVQRLVRWPFPQFSLLRREFVRLRFTDNIDVPEYNFRIEVDHVNASVKMVALDSASKKKPPIGYDLRVSRTISGTRKRRKRKT